MNNITLGSFTQAFISSSAKFSTWELLGIAFIIFALTMHYGRFINDLPAGE
jgi:hypothetical protein